jgi:ABC-2 type transport system ATP-binding protein
VRVRSPQAEQLRTVLSSAGFESAETSPGTLAVKDAPIERVGELAAHNQIVLHELSPESASLEEIFLELTGDAT